MATLFLGVLGSAIGGAFGGSILGLSGAVIGQAVGAAVGRAIDQQLLMGSTNTKTEGPRLDSLDVMSSEEGNPLADLSGRFAIAGEVIWATKLKEVVRTETRRVGSGKKKQSVTETTYEYFASFAVSLCEGPARAIGRVWADGTLVDLSAMIGEGRVRFYTGSETQVPDPLILATEGTAPAYRGTAYVVFEDFPLADYGNRVPQIKVEVWGQSGAMESLLRGINVIPGATEWGYMPVPVQKVERNTAGEVISEGPENATRFGNVADWKVSLDQLQGTLPDVQTVSLVVAWFGTDLRAGLCEIEPRVETALKDTTPAWGAAGLTRATAHTVSQVSGNPAYGSAPADAAVIAAIKDLKLRGLRVVLYPFIMMDITAAQALPDPAGTGTQGAYPWRGRIAPRAGQDVAAEVAAFMGTASTGHFTVTGETVSYSGPAEWRFRRFILHMANLAKAAGGVDAFLIGTEMRGLTMAPSTPGVYPFVNALKTLAGDVTGVLPAAEIGYAADWSEYHSHRPGSDVWFHLDPLWSDANIDFIGIDNYLPLADWRPGTTHLDYDSAAGITSPYHLDYLKGNIEGGEYWDWFYADSAARDAQVRTPITDGAYGQPWVFRQKAIRDWHGSEHHNRQNGLRLSLMTDGGTPDTWTGYSGATVTPLPGTFLGRYTRSATVTGQNSVLDGAESATFAMLASTTYRVSAWVSAGTSGRVRVYINHYVAVGYVQFIFATQALTSSGSALNFANIAAVNEGSGLWRIEFDMSAAFADTTVWLRVTPGVSTATTVLLHGAEVYQEGTSTTAWVPGSKPVWFTELGCAAIDLGANQPNVFVSPNSSEGAFPHYSAGTRDDYMQRQFLRAHHEWWAENGTGVLDTADIQVWCWDARPWPEFPQQSDLWADGGDWTLGHWLTGRAGNAPAAEAIARRLTGYHAVDPADIDLTACHGQADGYAAGAPISFRDYMSPLEWGLGLSGAEVEGRLVIASRAAAVTVAEVTEDVLVQQDGAAIFTATRAAIEDVAGVAVVRFRDGTGDYTATAARAIIGSGNEDGISEGESPLVLDPERGLAAAERLLRSAADGRETATFRLPRSAAEVRPGVILPFAVGGTPARPMIVNRVIDGIDRQVEVASYSLDAYAPTGGLLLSAPSRRTSGSAALLARFLDLPILPDSAAPEWDTLVAFHASPWPGIVDVARSPDGEGGFVFATAAAARASLGETVTALPVPGQRGLWDRQSFTLRLFSGGLVTRPEIDVLGGANTLAVQHAAGWEVLQFRDAVLTGPNEWTLSMLLRGQLGSEGVIAASPLTAGAQVVILDAAVVPLALPSAEIGTARWYRIGPVTVPVDQHAVRAHTGLAIGRRPYAPCHLRSAVSGTDLSLTWVRRTRTDGEADWRDAVPDVPLGEAFERYAVELGPVGAPLLTATVTSPAAVLDVTGISGAQEVRVAQVSETFGAGTAALLTVTL